MTDRTSDRPVHNIGVVARRTGIKADLVRAWERRYQAVVPERTRTARRLYSDADIRRLTLLRDATRLGHQIGHIASLDDDELEALLEPATPTLEIRASSSEPGLGIERRLQACVQAIEALDAPRLTSELERASFDLGRIDLVENLLVPLMDRVGTRWLQGEIDPAQEHLATAAVRRFVGGFISTTPAADAPTIVVTTPAGQLHELGALLAAAIAAADGWRVVYLGPDLPAGSIADAARRARSKAVALGITLPEPASDVVSEVEALAAALDGVELVVGGRGGSIVKPLAQTLGFQVVDDLARFRAALAELNGAVHRRK